jgi:hypothetical protein
MADIERYVGGGKLYFTPYTNGAYGTEREIGEIKEAKLKIAPSYVDAMSRDTGFDKKVDKTLKEIASSLSFTTQNVSKENMALAMLGTLSTETFAIGDTLPDGTVATAEVIIPVVRGGVVPLIEGKVRIVGVNVTGTANPVLEVPMCVLTPSGDIRDYFASEHVKIAFEGEILESNGEYFKEYFIPKS